MIKAKKELIDKLWMETEYGQWLLASASGNKEKADELIKAIKSKYPWDINIVDKELCRKIAEHLESIEEYEDYLKLLDDENYELVGFIIAFDAFGSIYDILKGDS